MSEHERDLDELLGAYALDAVDADERRRVEEYLRVNPRAAAEVRDHREVATLLAYTGADAPDGLWDRIADALDEPSPPPDIGLASVLPVDPARSRRSSAAPSRGRSSGLRRFGGWTMLAAAATVAVVAAAVTVVVSDRSSSPADPIAAAVEAARADAGARTTLLAADGSDAVVEAIVDDGGRGFLVADALPTLPADQTYQLWGVVGDDVISIGILGPRPSIETFTAQVDLAALAVTIEPAGGVVSDGNPEGAYVGTFG